MASIKRFTAVLMSVLMLITSMPITSLADTAELRGAAVAGQISRPNYQYYKADKPNETYEGTLKSNQTAINYAKNPDGTDTYLVRMPALPSGATYTEIGGANATFVSQSGAFAEYSVPLASFNANSTTVKIKGEHTSFSVIYNIQGVGEQYYDVAEVANQDVKYDAGDDVRQYIERVEYAAYAGQAVTGSMINQNNIQGAVEQSLSRAANCIAAGPKYVTAYNVSQGNKGFGYTAPTFDQNNPIVVSTGKEDSVEIKIHRQKNSTLEVSYSYSSSPTNTDYVYLFVQNRNLPSRYLILSQMHKAVNTVVETNKVFEEPMDLYITPLYGHYENYGPEDLNYTCDPLRSLRFNTIGDEYTSTYLKDASTVQQVLSDLSMTMTSFGTVSMGDVSAHQYHFHFAMPDINAKFEFRNYISGSEPIGFVVTSPTLTAEKWIKTGTNPAVKAPSTESGKYSFALYRSDGTLVKDGITNNSNGEVIFTIPITAADISPEFMKAQVSSQVFDFYLQEVEGDDPTVIYDAERHPIRVTLTLSANSSNFSATAEWVGQTSTNNSVFTNQVSNDRIIQVQKVWANEPAGTSHQAVKLYLDQYRNGTITYQGIRELTLLSGVTSASFDAVPIKDEQGNLFTYQVREEVENGSFYKVTYVQPSAENGYRATVTNTYASVTLTLVKVWENDVFFFETPYYRPTQVQFIVSDGNTYTITGSNESNRWTKDITVPKYDKQGNEIRYSAYENVTEWLSHYTTTTSQAIPAVAVNGEIVIKNTFDFGNTTSITVKKEWEEKDFGASNRADVTVLLTLESDSGVAIENPQHILKADEDWTHTWANLPKYKSSFMWAWPPELIEYRVSETSDHPEYDTEITGQGTSSVVITNTLKTNVLELKKVWNDNNKEKTFNTIVFTVEGKSADGEVRFAKDVTLNKSENWAASVEVPRYIDRQELTFTVTEKTAPVGYTAENNGVAVQDDNGVYVVTNTLSQVYRDITVTKEWQGDANDTDGKRTSIEVTLFADDWNTGLKRTISRSNGNWSTAVFDNQPVYRVDRDGKVTGFIEYRVEETPVEGYKATYSPATVSGIEGTWAVKVTNTYGDMETTSVAVQKLWKYDTEANRPVSIRVQLKKNGVAEGEPVTLKAPDWSTTWNNLPLNQPKTNEVDATKRNVYTVEEVGDVANYDDGTWSVTSGDALPIIGTITNRYNPHFDLTVNKSWDDDNNADGLRPQGETVTVQLYQSVEGAAKQNQYGEVVSFSGSYQFKDLPSYDADGHLYQYTVEETTVEGYTTTYSTAQTSANIHYPTITITNKHTPKTASLKIEKVWADGDNADGLRKPVTVRVYAGGQEVASTSIALEPGYVTIPGLQVYENGGKPIVYTVTEDALEGYTPSYSAGVDLTGTNPALTVTNTHKPDTTSFTVTKEWANDNNNADGNRPASVTVKLYQDGQPYDEQPIELKATNWTHTWNNLPKNYWANGKSVAYNYTVQEISTDLNYIMGGAVPTTDGATITNNYAPKRVSILVSKDWPDGVDGGTTEVDFALYYENGMEYTKVGDYKLKKDNQWKLPIDNLLKYRNGAEVKYFVEEAAVIGYSPAISGKLPVETKVQGQENQFTFSFTNNRNQLVYTVRYWRDRMEGAADSSNPNFLAEETGNAQYGETVGTGEVDHSVSLTKHRPNEKGYVTDGVISPTSIVIKDNDGVLNVLYTTMAAEYAVKYWLDSKETGMILSSTDHIGVVDQTVGDATADIQVGEYTDIAAHDGYTTTGVRDANITLVSSEKKVYNVVYTKKALAFDVEYVYDALADGMTNKPALPASEHQSVVVGDKIDYALAEIDPAFYISDVACTVPGSDESAVVYDNAAKISGTMPGHDVKYVVTLKPYTHTFAVNYLNVPQGVENEEQAGLRAGDAIKDYSLVQLPAGYSYDYENITKTAPMGIELRSGDDFSGNMPNGDVIYTVPVVKNAYTLKVTYQYSAALQASGLTLPGVPTVADSTNLHVDDPVSYASIADDMATLGDSRFVVSDIATGVDCIQPDQQKTKFEGRMPADNVEVVITIDAALTTYEVRYYQDSVTDEANYLGGIGPNKALVGDTLAKDGTENATYHYDLNEKRPNEGYQQGVVVSGDEAITLQADGTKNVSLVLYKPLRVLTVEYKTSDGKPVPETAGVLPQSYATPNLIPGTQETVAVPALTGYTATWASDPSAATVENTAGGLTVTMPDQNVKVTVTYTPVDYAFSVVYTGEGAPDDHNQQSLHIGEGIATYKMPALTEGYEYDYENITKDAGSVADSTEFRGATFGADQTFSGTMPAHDVVYTVPVIQSHMVTVEKIWQDDNNRDGVRPADVTIAIFGDGSPLNGAGTVLTASDNATTNSSVWHKTGIIIPVYLNGVKITSYTVAESALNNGYVMVANSNKFDVVNSLATVTNQREPETVSLTLNKQWMAENSTDDRPENVTFVLLANEIEIDRVTLSGDRTINNLWSQTITETSKGGRLYKYANGSPIEYKVYEVSVPKYDCVNTTVGAAVTLSGNAATLINTHQNAVIDVAKSITSIMPEGGYGLGDTVSFEVTVQNTGNQTLTSVQLDDVMEQYADGAARVALPDANNPEVPGIMQPGDQVILHYTYKVVEKDLAAEGTTDDITNTATATAKFGEKDVTDADSKDFTVKGKTYEIDVTKTVDDDTLTVGQTANFTISVTNTGTATLKNISLNDVLTRNKGFADAVEDGKNLIVLPVLTNDATMQPVELSTYRFTLASGESATFTCAYTAAAMDKFVDNTVTATAKVDGRDDVTDTDTASATVEDKVDFAIEKSIKDANKNFSTKPAQGETVANDTIHYQIVVSNTGNTKLNAVNLKDVLHRGEQTAKPLTQDITPADYSSFELLVGESKTFEVAYKLGVQDYELKNVATATVNGVAKDSEVSTLVGVNRELTIDKEVTTMPANGTAYVLGESIGYKVTIQNVGNQPLTNVTLEDTLVSFAGMTLDKSSTGTAASLEPGQTLVYTYTYVVQESDLGKVGLQNTATAKATDTPEKSDSETVDVDGKHPAFIITKEVVNADGTPVAADTKYAAGDTVYFRVTMTNSGNCALTNAAITDALARMTLVNNTTLSSETQKATLPRTESMVAYFSTMITEADLGKEIVNVSTGDADEVDAKDAAAKAETIAADSRIAVEKTTVTDATGSTEIAADKKYGPMDTVYFKVVVTNPGNLTLSDIALTDALDIPAAAVTLVSGDATLVNSVYQLGGTLTAGDTTGKTLIFSYPVTEADLQAAEHTYTNTAKVTATDSQGGQPTDTDTATFDTVARQPGLTVVKDVVDAQSATANILTPENKTFKLDETVTFRVVVTNSGNVALTNVHVADALTGLLSGLPQTLTAVLGSTHADTLAVGESMTMYYTYQVTEADLQRTITNTATATANETDGTDTATFKTEDKAPSMTAVKTVSAPTHGEGDNKTYQVGDTVTFTIKLTNTGNVTLTGVTLSDVFDVDGVKDLTKLTNFTYNAASSYTLAPADHASDSLTFTAQYTIGATDELITNAAVGDSNETEPTPESKVEVPVDQKLVLKVEKAASNLTDPTKNTYDVGDTVRFAITAENLGNRELTKLKLTDVFAVDTVNTAITVKDDSGITANVDGYTFVLGKGGTPSAKATFYADYVITAQNKKLYNVVTVSNSDVSESDDEPVTVTDKPALLAVKRVVDDRNAEMDAEHEYQLGDTVRFQIVVTNTGNTTLENVTLTDTMPQIADSIPRTAVAVNGTDNLGTLLPGQSATAYYTYKVQEGDLGQSVTNTVVATSGTTVSNEATDDFKGAAAAPDIAVLKKITNQGSGTNGAFQVGDTIEYAIYVINTGNTTLAKVKLTDALKADNHAETLLVPTFNPAGTEILNLPPVSAVQLRDSSNNYVLTGNNVRSFTASYTVKSTDAEVVNTATAKDIASGKEGKDTVSTSITPSYAVEITKVPAGATGESGSFKVGDTVTYTITVTNTGNYPLSALKLGDMFKLNGSTTETTLEVRSSNSVFELDSATFNLAKGMAGAAGESKTFTAAYKILPSDTKLDNTARVYNDKVDKSATSLIEVGRQPALTIHKTVVDENGTALTKTYALGDTVRFRIDVKNDGNVALTDVNVTDLLPQNRTAKLEAGSSASIGMMAIGAEATVYYTYVITENDLKGAAGNATGTLTNTGKVTGKYNDQTLEKTATADFSVVDYAPALTYVKAAANADDTKNVYEVGDTVNFTITLTNAGNVTLTNVTLDDVLTINGAAQSDLSKLSNLTYDKTQRYTLYPQGFAPVGESSSIDFTASYVIQPSDYRIVNAAKGDSDQTDPGDPSVVTVDVVETPVIEVTKAAVNAAGKQNYEVGDTVNFTIKAENKGNTELTGLKLSDVFTVDGLVTALTVYAENGAAVTDRTTFDLAIGQKLTFTASYTVDATTGKAIKRLDNHVWVGSDTTWPDADKGKTWDDGEAGVTITDRPEIEVIKTVANAPADGKAFRLGETVAFDITVHNRGNVDLTGIDLKDALLGYTGANILTDVIPALVVGASETIHYTYTIQEKDLLTEAEMAAGTTSRTNIAVTTADDGTHDDGSVDFPVEQQNPGLTVVKTVDDKQASYALGATVNFTVTVTNSGNMTLHDVKVEDDLANDTRTIAAMTPGAVETLHFSLIVTEAMLGKLNTNNADATGHTVPNAGTAENPSYPGDNKQTAHDDDTFQGAARDPKLKVEKTIQSPIKSSYALGDTITFAVTVENIGNVTVYDTVVSDPLCFAQNRVANPDKTIAKLLPGEKTAAYTFTYTIGEADLRATAETPASKNLATADGHTGEPTGDPDKPHGDNDEPVHGEDEEPFTTDVTARDMNVVKTVTGTPTGTDANGQLAFKVGDTVSYQIVVANIGNTTLKNVTMSDLLNIDSGESTENLTLNGYTAPFDLPAVPAGDTTGHNTKTFTASYVIGAGDKHLLNTATAVSGELRREDTAETDVLDHPAVEVVKSVVNQGSGNAGAFKTGDVVRYEIVVTNTGNVMLDTLALTDLFKVNDTDASGNLIFTESAAEMASFTLAPAASKIFHASYTVKDADVELYNYAKATDATTGATDDDNVTTTPGKNPIVQVTKAAVTDKGRPIANNKTYALGEKAYFLITVSNVGNVDLTNIVVNDPLTGDTETISSLPVGAQPVTFTFEYVVKESDILAGKVHNIVTAKPENAPEDKDEIEEPTEPKKPSLMVDKSETSAPADGKAYALGETVTFSVNVKNSGNVTLKDITVADAILGDNHAAVTLTSGTLPIATLAPNSDVTLTYAYVVQEADLGTLRATGEQTNRATATAVYEGKTVEEHDDEDFTTASRNPALEVSKTVKDQKAEYQLGDLVTFEVVVKNIGNVTLTNITLTDPICLAQSALNNADKTIAELKPGASSIAYTFTYTVQESDLGTTTAQGTKKNIAAATTTYEGKNVTDDDDADVTTETRKPALEATKEVLGTPTGTDDAGNKVYIAGDTISYRITLENKGNTTLTDVSLTDTLTVDTAAAALNSSGIPAKVTLVPGQRVAYDASYVIGQFDSGIIKNVIVAKHPDIPDETDEVETPVAEQPGIAVDKTVANMPQDGYKVRGTVNYQITVRNTGNTTLSGIRLIDVFTVDGTATELEVKDSATTLDLSTYTFDLVKNASKTFTARYTIADTDRELENTVQAGTGDPKDWDDDNKGETWDDGEKDVTVGENPALNVVKTVVGKPVNGKTYALGEKVTFQVIVENVGNMRLTGIVVSDPMCRTQDTANADKTIAALEPKAKETFTFTYVVQESDLGRSSVVNVATATADDGTKDEDDEPFTPDPEDPKLNVVKTVVTTPANANGTYALGQQVTYEVAVRNAGNVTLKNISVYDDLCNETKTIAELKPGAVTTVSFTYTIEEQDLEQNLTNIATASTTYEGKDVKDDDDETIRTEDKEPAHSIVKALVNSGTGDNGAFKAGETARFRITVQNTGNVTLHNLVVTDPLSKARDSVTNADQTLATLGIGKSATFTFTYLVTEADLGKTIINIATVKADETKPEDSNEVPVPVDPRKPKVGVEKTVVSTDANADGKYGLGETVRFAVKVSNLGNVELKRIAVNDQLPGITLVTGASPIASLPVGQSVTLYYEYVVKEADLSDTPILNVVTATPSEGEPDTDDEPFTPDPRQPKVDVVKTLTNQGTGLNGAFKLGETATFNVTVTNAGNVTLRNVQVNDQLPGARLTNGRVPIRTLAVGETVTLTYAYTIQAADLGLTIKNIVTATADDGTTDEDDEDFVTAPKPDIIVIVQTTDGSIGPNIPNQEDVTPGTAFTVNVPNMPGYTKTITVTSADTKFTNNSYNIGNTDVTGTMASEDVIITIIYSPRVDCRYRVEYYYDGVRDDAQTIQTTGVTYGTVVDSYQPKNVAGYRLSRQENLPLRVGTVVEDNVIRIYYVAEQPVEIIVPAEIPLGAGNAGLNVGVCAE